MTLEEILSAAVSLRLKWQWVEIPFSAIKPNPYFQPPGADLDAPFNVSDVREIGFAPQVEGSGRLAISPFRLVD
jgi:hypothetical protein